MENKIGFEIIISTCDKFSDLWDAHILLMNQNWKDRDAVAHLVTDKETNRKLEGVHIVCAGEGTEITQRLARALQDVKEKYILFTLDDYFLTTPIDNEALQRSLQVMETENLDYMRLYSVSRRYLRVGSITEFPEHKNYFLRNLETGNYKISLYPGLWRTDFMRQTLSETLNAWQYEVALTAMARKLDARCAISNNNEYPFLDVIRKGKVLRKANRYFKKNPIYQSDRPVMAWTAEFKIWLMGFVKRTLPRFAVKRLKRFLIKCGMTFYSPVE